MELRLLYRESGQQWLHVDEDRRGNGLPIHWSWLGVHPDPKSGGVWRLGQKRCWWSRLSESIPVSVLVQIESTGCPWFRSCLTFFHISRAPFSGHTDRLSVPSSHPSDTEEHHPHGQERIARKLQYKAGHTVHANQKGQECCSFNASAEEQEYVEVPSSLDVHQRRSASPKGICNSPHCAP